VPHSCRCWSKQQSLVAVFSFATPTTSLEEASLAPTKLCFCSLNPRNRPFTLISQGWAGLPVRRCCSRMQRRDPQYAGAIRLSWLQAQAIFPHGRIRSTVAPVSVAEQEHKVVGPHPTWRLISARSDFLPTSTTLCLAQTLHRDRRRGTRVTAGSGVLPSETVGVPHPTSCRLACHAPCQDL
jgi:hypothetical protein